MSKYRQLGPYHFVEFSDKETTYAKHVLDLVEQLKVHVGKDKTVLEVGCGEGLILSQLFQRLGWRGVGTDLDQDAVRMGKQLCPAAKIELRGLTHKVYDAKCYDVILFADSLEHIDLWTEHLEWSKKAQYVVIAVPDEHDRHGLRDFGIGSFDKTFEGWKLCHLSRRHGRFLFIWRRPDAT